MTVYVMKSWSQQNILKKDFAVTLEKVALSYASGPRKVSPSYWQATMKTQSLHNCITSGSYSRTNKSGGKTWERLPDLITQHYCVIQMEIIINKNLLNTELGPPHNGDQSQLNGNDWTLSTKLYIRHSSYESHMQHGQHGDITKAGHKFKSTRSCVKSIRTPKDDNLKKRW